MSKFYKCPMCGNIIGKIHDSGVPVVCCGKPMEHLEANTTEAAFEKHIPDVVCEGGVVKVQVVDMMGVTIESHSEMVAAGNFAHTFKAMPSGRYVVRVQQGSTVKLLNMQVK